VLKIVISGGPGTGKTHLIETFQSHGYVCSPEIIRRFTEELKKNTAPENQQTNPLVFSENPLQFNTLLLQGRTAQFHQADQTPAKWHFFDRSIVDVLAYMDHFDQTYPPSFIKAATALRYDWVFLLPPWKDIYVQDKQRLESFEEALKIHESLLASYREYNYSPVMVPPGTLKERMDYVLNHLDTTSS
jgi:predicted ATPase